MEGVSEALAMDKLAAVILAAGLGKRMRSDRPKVLHRVLGRPLVQFPVDLAASLGCDPIVTVVGHGREQVESAIQQDNARKVAFALQAEQHGTGHAVASALPKLRGVRGPVLILSGDVPLLDKASVVRLQKAYKRAGGPVGFITFQPENPKGYGRVIRKGKKAVAIREDRDCNKTEKTIEEVNSGIYLVDIKFLRRAIKTLNTDNSQGEFYLTDLVAMAATKNTVATVVVNPLVVSGVNDRVDLARIETTLQQQTNEQLMRSGVTIHQPQTVRIDLSVKAGRDSEIEPGVQLLGRTELGRRCRIETGAVINNAVISDEVVIKAYSVIDDAVVHQGAQIGPMGRLRPGSDIGEGAKVGNFVEIKNTTLGPGSKASHLAYLGDGIIGERVNVGAGTIFCNYDGFQKHQTILEDDVFIGSDSQLVAPVTVGRGGYVASGSTITRDVPPDALAVARAKQENKKDMAAFLRGRLAAAKERARRGKDKS
jgi:bifunctional UDP-N-acetylglucosamine pyrophosphorylase/glucosamine-1-phosphate N-acetyltransferase